MCGGGVCGGVYVGGDCMWERSLNVAVVYAGLYVGRGCVWWWGGEGVVYLGLSEERIVCGVVVYGELFVVKWAGGLWTWVFFL